MLKTIFPFSPFLQKTRNISPRIALAKQFRYSKNELEKYFLFFFFLFLDVYLAYVYIFRSKNESRAILFVTFS